MIPLLLAIVAHAGIELEAPPELGVETVILVADDNGDGRPGETVRVVHRPGLAGEREVAVGITDGRGRVRWTPQLDGVAAIRADAETLTVRIPPAEAPREPLTLLVLLLVAAAVAAGYGLAPRGSGGPRAARNRGRTRTT